MTRSSIRILQALCITCGFIFLLVDCSFLVNYKDSILQQVKVWESRAGGEGRREATEGSPSQGSVVSLCTGREGEGWEGGAPEHLAMAWTSSIVSVPAPGQVTGHNTSRRPKSIGSTKTKLFGKGAINELDSLQ